MLLAARSSVGNDLPIRRSGQPDRSEHKNPLGAYRNNKPQEPSKLFGNILFKSRMKMRRQLLSRSLFRLIDQSQALNAMGLI